MLESGLHLMNPQRHGISSDWKAIEVYEFQHGEKVVQPGDCAPVAVSGSQVILGVPTERETSRGLVVDSKSFLEALNTGDAKAKSRPL